MCTSDSLRRILSIQLKDDCMHAHKHACSKFTMLLYIPLVCSNLTHKTPLIYLLAQHAITPPPDRKQPFLNWVS